jgi:hypothetical protein
MMVKFEYELDDEAAQSFFDMINDAIWTREEQAFKESEGPYRDWYLRNKEHLEKIKTTIKSGMTRTNGHD